MKEVKKIRGVGVTSLKVGARLHFIKKEKSSIGDKDKPSSPERELERFGKAKSRATDQLIDLEERTRRVIGKDEAEIFEIHRMLLDDEDLNQAILEKIDKGSSCEGAIEYACLEYSNMLKSLDDPYLSERASDILDIKEQLLSSLDEKEKKDVKIDTSPYILVAVDLTPTETARLEKDKILGFVTFGGSSSSHSAILARAMGIPALVGTGAIDKVYDGAYALLDASDGTLIINPTNEEKDRFLEQRDKEERIAREHERYLRSIMNKPAVTRSGYKIMIYANIESSREISGAISNGAEGIGLLRSEMLYMSKKSLPTEEELFLSYKEIAEKMEGRRVIIRTLDIGADKQAPYFNIPKEENPALGLRGVRVCLRDKEMFKSQLRAILRASYYGRVSVMIPMIVSVSEIRECKALINDAMRELRERKESFDEKIEIGIMIETPASAIMSEELAKEVDFFSVGTNDLSQYTLATDRQNPSVSHICEENAEPVLRLIKMATDAIHKRGGWIGVCGEMAADLSLTQSLAKIGVDELSVSVPYLLGIRGKVSECI
ncbi:MAG: phosphoenolpyruvate--protein phosphotransferase [Clostridia bacterium]|nr:phosphoenolpyruvate--protein phosphotransferase [Clostridia bacterium]